MNTISTYLPNIPVGRLTPIDTTTRASNAVLNPKWKLCDGSILDKSLYPELSNLMGANTITGNGQAWRQQYSFNSSQSTDITGWVPGTSLPGALGYSQAVVTKNRVYLLGGYTGSAYVTTVYTAPINSDGTLGTWTTGTNLPVNAGQGFSQVLVTNSRVYLIGGQNGATSILSTVYSSPINSDGTLGTWVADSNTPTPTWDAQAISTNSRAYVLGGSDGSAYISTVYTALINSDGTLGTWTTASSLPGILGNSQAVVTKNRVYLLGGQVAFGGVRVSTVYTAPINSDGTLGTWTTGTSLPDAWEYSQAVVTKNRVYLIGGVNLSAYQSTVYTAPINSDGTLGTWTTGTNLPTALGGHQLIVTNSKIYTLGGNNGTSVISSVYYASFSGGYNDYSGMQIGTNVQLPTMPNTIIKVL